MSCLQAEHLSYSIKDISILEKFSLSMEKGLHVILGANGAGKSTLLALLAGDMKASSGMIELNGKNIQDYSLQGLAQERAVLTQENPFGFPLTVKEVCALGVFEQSRKDFVVSEMLDLFQLKNIEHRKFNELSGGEKQRVHLARVFCQENEVLFLDEPLNHLDIHYQIMVMRLLKSHADKGKLIICILHDIQQAIRFADSLSILKQGKTIFQETLKSVSDYEAREKLSKALSVAFDIDVEIDAEFQLRIGNF